MFVDEEDKAVIHLFCGKSPFGDKLRKQLGTKEKFLCFINSLCLTDRQKEIAYYKLLKGWRNIDVAEKVGISERRLTDEIKTIQYIIGTTDIFDKGGEVDDN